MRDIVLGKGKQTLLAILGNAIQSWVEHSRPFDKVEKIDTETTLSKYHKLILNQDNCLVLVKNSHVICNIQSESLFQKMVAMPI